MSAVESATKACTGCGETKSLDAYHRNKQGKHGRAARCKECMRPEWRERARARLASDPEAERARLRENTRRSRQRHNYDRDKARRLAIGRAATWVREHHPEVWDAILEQCEREKGVTRDLWERAE